MTFAWLAFSSFAFFLLLVEELLVIGDAAHGGIGFGRNLDQVELHLVRELECVADREYDGLFDVVADHAHLGCRDLVVDTVRIIRFFSVENRVLEASVSVNCYSRESMVAAGMDEVVLL